MSVIKTYKIEPTKINADYTYSDFKRSDVLKNFEKCLIDRNYEKACIWAIELDISNFSSQLWNKIQAFIIKEINISCPNLYIYLYNRISENIYNKNKVDKGELHNNQHNRNNIIEMICIICLIDRSREIKLTKIDKKSLIIDNIKDKFIYKDTKLLESIIHVLDDKNIIKPCVQLSNILRKNDNKHETKDVCMYWISWLFEYNESFFKKIKKYVGDVRKINDIPDDMQKDVLFIIWEIVFYECKYRNNSNTSKLIQALFNLFKLDIKKSNRRQKIGFLFIAISILLNTTPGLNFDNNIIPNNQIVIQTVMKSNSLYYSLKSKDDSKTYYKKELKVKELNGSILSNEQFFINDKETYKKFVNKKDKEVIVNKIQSKADVKNDNRLNGNAIEGFKKLNNKKTCVNELKIKCIKNNGKFF